jgi:hypothetical protein
MRRKSGVCLTGLAALVGVLLAAPAARADDQQVCLAASEKAQQLRNAGKLTAARVELVTCGRAECPKLVQQDCTEWMKEVLAILPTVVPGAKDDKGRDVVDAKVSVDGKLLTETLDGKPFAVDPGVHTFRFESKAAPPVEERVVVRQGEKNRIITITLSGSGGSSSENEDVKSQEPSREKGSQPIAAYVTGGLGLLALGAALYIDLDANADARRLRETCAPNCAQTQVDDIESRYVIAGVTAAVGGAALVAGVVLFLIHDRGESKRSASRFLPGIGTLSRGGPATAGFRF